MNRRNAWAWWPLVVVMGIGGGGCDRANTNVYDDDLPRTRLDRGPATDSAPPADSAAPDGGADAAAADVASADLAAADLKTPIPDLATPDLTLPDLLLTADLNPTCGNNKLEPGEACDGSDLGAKTCKSLGYASGTLACLPGCKLDLSGCIAWGCGNGVLNPGEACDGAVLGSKTCKSLGFGGGTLACQPNCQLDTSGCSLCGNGKLDKGEACDKAALGAKSCASLGLGTGVLACLPGCQLDTSGCSLCGNGKLDPGEACDGAVLGSKTCKSLGYVSGALACQPNCQLDTTSCTRCGDGKLDSGEQCDKAALGAKTCTSLGYDYGTLACSAKCQLDTAGCKKYGCGDGKITGSEQCEGSNLQGKTCQSLGYVGGALACSNQCLLDTTACHRCGDAKLDKGEQCDGAAMGSKSCKSYGYSGGVLACTSSCVISKAGCYYCGDKQLNPGEQCDKTNLGGKTCQSLGYAGGKLYCYSNCKLRTSYCHNCGDGKLNPGEQCDKIDLAGKSCTSLGYAGGNLACYSNCKLNKKGCYYCGDKKINPGEQCDKTNLAGNTCKSLGYYAGALKCLSNCTLNKAGCHNCGDSKLDKGEQCDKANLGGNSCTSLGYHSGTLKCLSNCTLNKAGCSNCGNGMLDKGEQCDGAAMGGSSCKSLGFFAGTLTCLPGCAFNKAGCHNCGNGKLDKGEQCDGAAMGSKSCKTYGFDGGALACTPGCAVDQAGCYKIKLLVDDTYAHFSQGALTDAGVKLYASAKGNVQLLDRLDLNGDGKLDLVFSNYFNGVSSNVSSHIYWGASGGFTSANRSSLPTVGAQGTAAADLNDDGHLDLVFANFAEAKLKGNSYIYHNYLVNSYVYWGSGGSSGTGYSAVNKTELPTRGATGAAVADLNRDGYLDLVFTNEHGGATTAVNAYIYWGSAAGFSANNRAELPTLGTGGSLPGRRNAVADLDDDGHLDLVFANYRKAGSYAVNSYIYWGSTAGYSVANRAELPTSAATGCSVADLDDDGRLDLVFANHRQASAFATNSYIYWGSAAGFSASNRAEVPTLGAVGSSVADLDGDGRLDLVFASRTDGATAKVNSYVYWGQKGGYAASNRTALPTVGAGGSLVADLDGDGRLDLVFANRDDGTFWSIKSYIYWGSAAGFSTASRSELPTVGASWVSTSADPGSLSSRGQQQVFLSRVHDTGLSAPVYHTLTVLGVQPQHTDLRLQVRSAATPAALASAPWYGPTTANGYYTALASPTALNSAHKGQRYLQYRALLSCKRFSGTPVLDRVVVAYH